MKKYNIKKIVEVSFWFKIEADSEDEAIDDAMMDLKESIKKCYAYDEDPRDVRLLPLDQAE